MKKDLLIVTTAFLFLVAGFNACFASSPEKLYSQVNPKVVKLHMIFNKGGGVCSGAFVSDNGLVLTCAHCFEQIEHKLFVKTNDGKVYMGELLRTDRVKDLALVYTGAKNTPYLHLGRKVKIGQRVFAFGAPLDLQN